jgi:non-specific serine/threonine protein kinase
MALARGTRFGPYEILDLIGAGGMGEVYKARDTRLDRTVAIKVLLPGVSADPSSRARFEREAKTIARLAHPHICTLHDVGEEAGSMFLVMAHLEGTTLARLIDNGPLPIEQALKIGAEIADAVDAAHQHGVVHRDLKPTNVIITSNGDAVVLDFGVAKRVSYPQPTSEDPTLEPTRSSVVMGTVSYMAPEQALGKPTDFRSDIFSLGVVLYEMVAGRRPFSGSTSYEIIDAIIHRVPTTVVALNPAVPLAVERVITRCLEKAPEDRFQAAAEVAGALRNPVASALPDGSNVSTARLPHQLTRFIGRRREISEVRSALSDARLVTLSGPGGIGKTRLALRVASDAIREYADGVWFVDLAPVSEPDLVPQTLASVLGIREEPGQPLSETLRAYIAPKSLLLVLDNCEHLVGACALLADTLLRTCPRLRILATSREPLSITGEEILRVPSLSLPDPDQSASPASIADHEAVQLFVDRARLVKSTFALTSSNAVAVARICVRLEGMPLAIELAASRVRVLSVDRILAKLHDRLGLLTGGSRTATGRHQTLLAAIDWSYNLLNAAERTLFRRLAVFSGGWTLEAAEAICAGDGVARTDVLELLSGLVDKSLVLTEEWREYQRYRLMMTVQEYAQNCLRQTDDQPALERAHVQFFTAFAVEGEAHLMSPGQEVWLQRLNAEHDNIRAALKWASTNDVELALRLGAALGRFWYLQGYWGEGRGWLEALLELEGGHLHPGPRAQVLNATARLIQQQGEHEPARSIAEEALRLARTCGDEREVAVALNTAAINHGMEGDFAAARVLLEESLAIRRRLGNKGVIALTLNNLGVLATLQAEYMTARALLHESLGTFREIEDKHGIAMALVNCGDLVGRTGDEVVARSLVEEGLALARSVGDKALIPVALNTLGELVCRQGEHETARALNEEALEVSRQVGDKRVVAATLLSLGIETEHREAYAEARRAVETTLTLLRELGHKPKIAVALNCLGRIATRDGDYAGGKLFHEESLEMCRRMGMRDCMAESLFGLASVAQRQGDHRSALALCRQSLAILLDIGDQRELPHLLEKIALLLILQRQTAPGASLYGAAQALRERTNITRPPNDRVEYEQHVEWSRRELGDERFTAAWADGRAMPLEQAISCALNDHRLSSCRRHP